MKKTETKRIKLQPSEYGQLECFCQFMRHDYKTVDGVVEDRPARIKTAERDLKFFPGLFIKIEEAKILDGSETLYFAEFSADTIEVLEFGVAAILKRFGIPLPTAS